MQPVFVRFHFDPQCPFTYKTSQWIRRAAQAGAADLHWGLFSLQVLNDEWEGGGERSSGPALRTALLVDERTDALGRFYPAFGRRRHELGEPLDGADTITGALRDADLDPDLYQEAMADAETWERVRTRQEELAARRPVSGSPLLVIDGDDGPAVTGPVIAEVPDDPAGVLASVVTLARTEAFGELRRSLSRMPDLESVRQFQRGEG